MQSRLSFQQQACASSSASTRPPGPCAHQLPIVIDEAVWEKDAQWCNWKASLQSFKGKLKVLELCGGSGAGYLALHKLLPIGALQLVGHWDTDGELMQMFNVIHGKSTAMHLGSVEGDILGGSMDRFPIANIVIAGPPCPPWSKLGKKESFGDKRADVFWRVVDIVLHQANQGPLGMFVLENVESLQHKNNGVNVSPLNMIMEKLQAGLPEAWVLAAHTCNSLDFGMPQRRSRVYIVGHRSDLFGAAPFSKPEHFARRSGKQQCRVRTRRQLVDCTPLQLPAALASGSGGATAGAAAGAAVAPGGALAPELRLHAWPRGRRPRHCQRR